MFASASKITVTGQSLDSPRKSQNAETLIRIIDRLVPNQRWGVYFRNASLHGNRHSDIVFFRDTNSRIIR